MDPQGRTHDPTLGDFMTSYQPGIPTGTVNLDVDYQNLQNNFQQLDTTYGTDHVAFSQAINNGYHTAIHLIPQATPIAVTGIAELYSQTTNDGINTSQQLFYQIITGTPATLNIPLTRNFLPVGSGNGRTFLPGGIILQWGSFSAVSQTDTPILFTTLGGIAFPGNCFIVLANMNNSVSDGNLNIKVRNATGFTYYNTSGSVQNYSWIAIGI